MAEYPKSVIGKSGESGELIRPVVMRANPSMKAKSLERSEGAKPSAKRPTTAKAAVRASFPFSGVGEGSGLAFEISKPTHALRCHVQRLPSSHVPNQSLEPTPTAGTSAAEQPLVPAAVVAHL